MWCDVKLLDLILPVHCVVCGAGGEQLCPACRGALPRLSEPLCARCGAPTAWPVERCRECAGRRLAFASARAAVAYDPAVRQLVRAWKERGLRTLAAVAADAVADALPAPAVAALAFVPSDRARGLERGHHPGRAARARARRALVAAGARAARQDAPSLAAARADTRRPPAQRRRCVRPCRRIAVPGRARRRRLHQRLDRERRRERAPQGRCAAGRGDYVRAGRPLDSAHRATAKERGCSSR